MKRHVGTVFQSSAHHPWDLLARYSALLNREAGYVYAKREAERLLTFETPHRTGGLGPQLNEFSIALVVRTAIQATSTAWTPTHVWFAHEKATSDAVLALLKCPITFGAPTSGLSIPAAVGNLVPSAHDPALNSLLTARLNELMPASETARSVSARVRSIIMVRMGRDKLSIGNVARTLGASPRTLQRLLAEEETSFATLVEECRHGLAETLLARSDLSLSQVSSLLGYSDLRGFDRAFYRWKGQTPSEWRRQS